MNYFVTWGVMSFIIGSYSHGFYTVHVLQYWALALHTPTPEPAHIHDQLTRAGQSQVLCSTRWSASTAEKEKELADMMVTTASQAKGQAMPG